MISFSITMDVLQNFEMLFESGKLRMSLRSHSSITYTGDNDFFSLNSNRSFALLCFLSINRNLLTLGIERGVMHKLPIE